MIFGALKVSVINFLLLLSLCLPLMQVMWTFSLYLEAVAILPQLVLLQRTKNIDNLTGQYILLLGYGIISITSLRTAIFKLSMISIWFIFLMDLMDLWLGLSNIQEMWLPLRTRAQIGVDPCQILAVNKSTTKLLVQKQLFPRQSTFWLFLLSFFHSFFTSFKILNQGLKVDS